MACSVYYDVANESALHWGLPMIGLALGMLGGMIYVLADTFSKGAVRWAFKLGALIFSASWVGVTFFFSAQAYLNYQRLTAAIVRGDIQHVEGVVTDFMPAPSLGARIESFTVDGRRFSYSANSMMPGFRKASSDGGPLHEGLRVRIAYVAKEIVRLEICG